MIGKLLFLFQVLEQELAARKGNESTLCLEGSAFVSLSVIVVSLVLVVVVLFGSTIPK